MARIAIKSWGNCSTEEKKELKRLTLRGASSMKEDVIYQSKNLHRFQCFIARENEQIIGWAVAIPAHQPADFMMRGASDYTNIYTFIDFNHRRKGVGTQILGRVKKWLEKNKAIGRVFKWSIPSKTFYEKVAKGDYFTTRQL